MHTVLRPAPSGHDAGMRQSLPHPVHPVRAARPVATGRGHAPVHPALTGPGSSTALWPGWPGVRRSQCLLPAHGQAGDLSVAQRAERGAAEPEQRRWLSGRPGHSCRRCDRRIGGSSPAWRGRPIMLLAEHFVRSPQWEWFILGYFFLAGLTGGSYALATMLRLLGGPDNEAAARVGFYVAFVAVVPCPILLTVDLGQPLRFWHMMVNTTPDALALNFKYWSPMSLGVWALLVYGAIVTVSFLEVLIKDGVIRNRGVAASLARLLDRAFGRAFNVVGSVLGLFIASYTGVLLSVSNQPIW